MSAFGSSFADSPRERYRAWIDGIFDHCFPVGKAGELVAFAFDDDVKHAVANSIGAPTEEFEELTRGFARPSDPEDAFRFWRPAEDDGASYPTYVGILGALTLAASRIEYDLSLHGGFHRAFNALIGSTSGSRWTAGFGDLTRYWNRLAAYLDRDCAGDRGMLLLGGDDVYHGGRHVAAAIAQILLSRADRANLPNYFNARFGHVGPLARDPFLAAIEADVSRDDALRAVLPVVLRRRYKKLLAGTATDDRSLLARLRELVFWSYTSWTAQGGTAEHLAKPRIARGLQGPHEDPTTRVSSGLARSSAQRVVRLRDGTALRRSLAAPAPQTPQKITSINLGLDPGFGQQPWTLWATARNSAGALSTCTISARPNDADALDFFTTDGLGITFEVPAFVAFELSPNDTWTRVTRVAPDREAAVIVRPSDVSEMVTTLRRLDDRVATHAIRSPLDNYYLLRFRTGPLADHQAQVAGASAVISTPSAYVWLSGGLQFGGAYLSMAPPTVQFSRAGVLEADVILDERLLGRVPRESPFELPVGLATQLHRVRISDGFIEFYVTSAVVSSRLDHTDDVAIGWELSRPGSLARCIRAPGSQPLTSFSSSRIRLIVGGIVE